MKKRALRILFFLILAIAVITALASCRPYSYTGNHPEMFTVAINSLLEADGYLLSEIKFPPRIISLEKDEYGRILFAYCEGSILSLLVLQKSDTTYSYYYPDYNFIITLVSEDAFFNDEVFNNELLNAFSDDDKQRLKEQNDWGKEYDESKCVKTTIVRRKIEPNVKLRDRDFEILFEQFVRSIESRVSGTLYKSVHYCTVDNYGQMLYCCFCSVHDTSDNGDAKASYFQIVLIVSPDGSYNEDTCIMELADLHDYQDELTDLYKYQDQLKAFKERNGWNTPFE